MDLTRLLIQRLHVRWTKASRGGEGAVARAAIPQGLQLPPEAFAAPITLHAIHFSEHDSFIPADRIARFDTIAELPFQDVRLQPTPNGVSVVHVRDPLNAAVADRLYNDEFGNAVYDIDAFSLTDGEWGQVQFNGRYTCIDSGRWWYEHSVYNIGLLKENDVDRFTGTDPICRFVELVTLH